MTSLLTSSDTGRDQAVRRPMVAVAALGGAAAAAGTLVVCLGVGVIGWFLTDAGAHGTPSGGLRVGALGWLMGHGSGVHVEGIPVTVRPLGLTLLFAWVVWRIGWRVGDAVSGHGPDIEAIADGERDWTVPVGIGLFAAGYVVTATVVSTLAATPATDPSTPRVVLWSLLLSGLVAGPAIAIASGRAAIWVAGLPVAVRATALAVARILLTWLAVTTVALLVAFVVDLGTAINVMSQLHTDVGDAVVLVLACLLVVPNAVAWSGAYLLGPGFSVGAGTVVSPNAVALGPLPMFPLLAALPDDGDPAGWTAWLVLVPVLVAALGAGWAHRTLPTARWDEGAVRGGVGGVVTGIVFAVLAALAGGAVGPGRMADVGPAAFDVLVHAVTAFGVGGLLGGLAMTWWTRRGLRTGADADPDAA